jgi:hypothetical protein
MDLQRAAEIQVVLEGISLPATRTQLVRYASSEDSAAAAALERIPARSYGRIDEVGEALAPTSVPASGETRLPRAESDKPPGGDDYLNASPESGRVREDAPPDNPPQKTIEQQTKAQQRQQRKR